MSLMNTDACKRVSEEIKIEQSSPSPHYNDQFGDAHQYSVSALHVPLTYM